MSVYIKNDLLEREKQLLNSLVEKLCFQFKRGVGCSCYFSHKMKLVKGTKKYDCFSYLSERFFGSIEHRSNRQENFTFFLRRVAFRLKQF